METPIPPDLPRLAAALAAEAAARRQRRLLLLAGEREWVVTAAQAALAGTPGRQPLWITSAPPSGVEWLPAEKGRRVLGRELGAAVFDAHSGFEPDAFGALSGALHGGGLLLLLTPSLATWPGFADPAHARMAVHPYPPSAITGRFLARLARTLAAAEGVTAVAQGEPLPPPPPPPSLTEPRPTVGEAEDECLTADQHLAVAAIERVALGRRRRPVVLTSDRGRGKSAALGIAAARLLRRGIGPIVVTAPARDAVEPLFEQAARLLPEAERERSLLRLGGATLEFAPPDEQALQPRPAKLVLVDEAAAIPAPLLERLLEHHARIAFATTVHGYEGTGRGFAVRFQRTLERLTPGWRALSMEQPIRWAGGDPLERLTFRALLLDAAPAPDAALAGIGPDDCTVERLDRDALAGDEATLNELFGLLVLAHYRTSPDDLRNLLDGPNLSLWLLRHGGHVVATALLAREGGFTPELAFEIFAGRRRPHGNMLPETLASHVGLADAPTLRGARVMRIAVHPAAQGRGLGSRLLTAVAAATAAEGLDYLGAGFGATPELLRFWRRHGFAPVRLSVTRGHTSGAHSAVVLKPLSAAGEGLCRRAAGRFHDQLPHQLGDPLRALEAELAAAALLRDGPPSAPPLSPQEWREVAAFAFALRGYEVTIAPLWRLAASVLGDTENPARLERGERDALIVRVLQRWGWSESAAALGLAGRAAVRERLRAAARRLVECYGDAALLAEAQRLAEGGLTSADIR